MKYKVLVFGVLFLMCANTFGLSVSDYRKHENENLDVLKTYLDGVLAGFYFGNVVAGNKLGGNIYCKPESEPMNVEVARAMINKKIFSGKFSESDSIEILFVMAIQEKYPCAKNS